MANKREFPRDMSFVDRQGKVVHPSREDYLARKSAKVGKAYAFFDCDASKGTIEKELPFIRDAVQTPSELELSLIEGTNALIKDPRFQFLQRIRGRKYSIEATYPNATNKQTADELAPILNQAYQSPLYKEEEQFRGEIVYEKNGEYVFRE